MVITKTSLANSLAFSSVILWTVCAIGVAFLPDFTNFTFQMLTHGINMGALGVRSVSLFNFIFGGLFFTVFSWLFGFLLGWSLEYFGKK